MILSRSLALSWRVFFLTASIVVAVLGVALATASRSVRRTGEESVRRGLEQATDLVAQFLAGRERSLAGGARVFVQGPYFRAIVAERRRDDILDQAFEAAEQLDADWVFITDEQGVLLAKSDEPGASGDALNGVPLIAGALQGRQTSGFGVSRDSLLFQAVAVPIVVPGGAPVGVLVATRIVDSLLARDVKAATASDVVFYAIDAAHAPHVAASTLGPRPDVSSALAATLGRAEGSAWRVAVVGGTTYSAQGASLTTAGGEVVGGFVVLRSRAAALAGIVGVRRSLLAAGALGMLLALVAAWAAARSVTRPAMALATAMRRAAEGDYAAAGRASAGVRGGARERDEIAALGAAFETLLAELRDKAALVSLLGGAPAASVPAAGAVQPGAPSVKRPAGGGAAAPRRAARPLELSAPDAQTGALAVGQVLAGRYVVQDTLGAGGMGLVYRARDLVLGETVAVKTLRAEALAADPGALERFKDEIRLARRISHRNVVRTHDLGESEGVPFLTMEYVEGTSLAALLRERGPLPAPAVLSIAKQLCRALEVAHEQGVVHGDIKPQNLLVGRDGVLKVTDFGVARLTRRRGSPTAEGGALVGRVTGAVVGTPEYMAPELLLGQEPDARTDIYAAGMVLHECLTGANPFPADTPLAFLARKLDPDDASREEAASPGTPTSAALVAPASPAAALADIVARMTARDAEARPTTAGEVLAMLRG